MNKNNPDKCVHVLLSLLTGMSVILLFLIVLFLAKESWPVLAHGTNVKSLFSGRGWHPLEKDFNLVPMILASLLMTAGAIILAAPLGLIGAIFIVFYARNIYGQIFKNIVSLLAGIPSVVYGLWGLTVLVPFIAQIQPPGASLLTAVLILTFMIIPTIALTSMAALQAVPVNLIAGAQALGMTRTGQIVFVALPAARSGITGGIVLAVARALGETMAVLMVAGNVVQVPNSLFSSVRALTANIALEMAYATDIHRASLFVSGLFLTILVFILSWIASHLSGVGRHA